jgi:peptidoglycan/xylan/chitin deacetylase (PgdA/CDA1 family)
MVLMYHRIAEVEYDPWQLSVSPSNFDAQMSVLQRQHNVIPISELIKQVHNKEIEKDCVCITFDDGYADNFLEAKPLLEKHKCPATFYIATKFIGSGKQFWWDELESIMLSSNYLPPVLNFKLNGKDFHFDNNLGKLTSEDVVKHKQWVWPDNAPTARCELYLSVWETLIGMNHSDIENAIVQIRMWADYKKVPEEGKVPMTQIQLKVLADHTLFELGIHTHSHPALPFHSALNQRGEIAECKSILESNFGGYSATIAYPYGRSNADTLEAVRAENLMAGFTTDGSIVMSHKNCYQLGRMQVNNWTGYQFEHQLKMWSKTK